MNSLKRATTIPKRKPSARSLPATAPCFGFGGASGLYFLVTRKPNLPQRHRATEKTRNPISELPLRLCVSVVDRYFPLNAAARFSRNALVPSFLSSVAQATAKRV